MLRQCLTPKRLSHSLSVERVSVDLALIHGIDPCRAAQVGLLHDNARDMKISEARALGQEAGLSAQDPLMASMMLVHAPVGAYRAQRVFGVEDAQVLRAVRWHTTGRAGMEDLEKVVYLADLFEPGRRGFPEMARIVELSLRSLDAAMHLALESSIRYIHQKRQVLHPDTQHALTYFTRRMREETI